MIYAFGIYVVSSSALIGYCVWALLEKDARACNDRQRLEAELFAAVGKTELVSLAIGDSRPPGQVSYIDEERELELRKGRNG